jgi:hypothetical protein
MSSRRGIAEWVVWKAVVTVRALVSASTQHLPHAHTHTHTHSLELARFGGGKAAAAASPNARNYWPDVYTHTHYTYILLWQSPLIAGPESSVKAHKA